MSRIDLPAILRRPQHTELPPVGQRPRVVVIGGGFAGLAAARRLRDEPVDVVLVDQRAYNTFQPLIYQVASGNLNPGDVTWPLRSIHGREYGARFVLGQVDGIDAGRRRVRLVDGRELPYDYLVIATGVVVNYFGIEGADEHAFPLYTRAQALDLRDRMQVLLEQAARGEMPEELRVVIVGGGATGVETAGTMAEMRNKDFPTLFPELRVEDVDITLVEMAPTILGPFGEDSQRYATRALERRGVDVRTGTSVTKVTPDGVMLKEGEDGEERFLPAQIVVWASGIRAPESVSSWGVEQGRGGRIVVDDHLRVKGQDRIFAVGDISIVDGSPLPQQAQPAMQSGRHAAAVIAADVAGRDAGPFEYKDLGSLATIGRSDAVAEIAGRLPNLKGFPAWLTWNVVHIRALLGGRNQLASMVNLGTKYLFWSHDHNVIVGDPDVNADVAPTVGAHN